MKNTAVVFLSVCCFATLLIVPMGRLSSVGTAFALNPANAIWVEPPTVNLTNVNVGYKFNVTIWVNLKDPCFAWQVRLNFNSTVLHATRVGYSGYGQSQFFHGHSTAPAPPVIDNPNGYVLFAESLLGVDAGAPGSGSLCWMEFQLMAEGVGSDKFNISNAGTMVLDPDLYDLSITKYDAQIVWSTVGPLAVSVSPDSASVHLLQSVTFASITVGGAPPYSYQWYLNGSPVSGAASSVWTFALEPSGNYSTGPYSVHLKVTDSMGNNAISNQASVTVSSLFGDLNNDSKVDTKDVSLVARAFGSSPNGPSWNILADVNQDGKVDIKDVALVAKHFGQHYP